ncbi:MAG: hypothetical protein IJZ57_11460 [Clostridia bacterium]|nr:hypothetical protein [Clostridia bacterium]
MKKILQRICDKTKLDKKAVLIILVGLMGIVMLAVSEIIPEKESEIVQEQPTSQTDQSYESYAENTEKRLEEMISSIQGAGKTKVMVTLDCSDENVYATEEKSGDTSYENSVVIIENQDGESGMLIKVTQPKIRGVAVVCSGGASPTVRQSIIDTVTAVLDISSARVSIATMKTDNGG